MLELIIAIAGQASIAAHSAPTRIEVSVNPNANALFDRDPLLRQWALRLFDRNRDGWLSLYEAQPALAAFKDLADGDRDGRVTPYEYDRAKELIAARR